MSVSRDRILIDLNSVGHAAHQGSVLRAGSQETQAVFGTIHTIRKYRLRHPEAAIVGLWDGKSWRKSVSTVYKAQRLDTPEKVEERRRYESQAPFIRRALKTLGVAQMFALNLEADDLAAILSKRWTEQGDFVRLVTGDRDWLQLVNPLCIWEDHREETRKVNVKSFPNEKTGTGYATPLQFVQAKALQGDVSDNLPGVGRIGEKGAADLIGVWGRVEAFLADPDREGTYQAKRGKKLPKAFKDFATMEDRQANFFHNMQMMNLLGELPAPEKPSLVRGPLDPDGFKSICHELGFSSIYREGAFEKFIEPFRVTH